MATAKGLPPPEQSWMAYQCRMRLLEDDQIGIHKPLAGSATVAAPSVDFSIANAAAQDEGVQATPIQIQGTPGDAFQRVGPPSIRLRLSGFAVRYGYRIEAPRLAKVGRQTPVQLRADITETTIGGQTGVPVYALKWEIDYAVALPIAELPLLANPLMLTGGDERLDLQNPLPLPG